MDIRRIKQVFKYGWRHAGEIAKSEGINRHKIFIDILYCYFHYNVWSNQYKKEKLYSLKKEQKRDICIIYQTENTRRDKWVKEFFDNYKFLKRWSSLRYETSAKKQEKRRKAYKKRYDIGNNCFIGYGVIIHKHHYSIKDIIIGDYCQFSENANIDYTGGLIIGNGVGILDGVKILTHGHDYLGMKKEKDILKNSKRAFLSPLEIRDNVTIGSHAIIMPGVHYIGKNSMISAGSVVTKRIPDNVIVAGNPAKIIGSIEGLNIHERTNNNPSIL